MPICCSTLGDSSINHLHIPADTDELKKHRIPLVGSAYSSSTQFPTGMV
jgi:hypothetical protein